MEKYIYIKKLPNHRVYKSKNKISRKFSLLEKNKKRGIIFILLGICVICLTFISSIPLPSSGSSILNPIPLDILAKEIQSQNDVIDAKSPLENYLPQQTDKNIDTTYDKIFYISFPSLNLIHVKVKSNVDSTNSKEYEEVLSQSTAHFKGTPLPGEGGNTFIYGHSSVTWFHQLYPYSYEGVFTALFDLKIGDPILIDFNGTTYHYVVEGEDTIHANDFAQTQTIQGINTLTLMTCSPPGVGDKRLIIKAIQI